MYAVSKKCWALDARDCDNFRSDIRNSYPDIFSSASYCTSTAVEYLHDRGIPAPDGIGKVKLPDGSVVDVANPKDMYEQIINENGTAIGSESGGGTF